VVAGVVVPPSGLVVSAGGVSPDGHGGGQAAVVGEAGVACPAAGAAGSVVAVAARVSAGTHVGGAGWSVGVDRDAGWLDGVTGADGVAAAAATGGLAAATGGGGAGLAAAGGVTVGGATVGGATVGGAGEADAAVADEWRTLSASGDRGLAGGEDRDGPEPLVNQESKPGATTPMSGICSGPPTNWKSMAAVGDGP
jgi:hypothetical protein